MFTNTIGNAALLGLVLLCVLAICQPVPPTRY
jgi:hypothetical protein